MVDYAANAVQLTQSLDGTFCCGSANVTCCNQNQAVHISSILGSSDSSNPSSTASSLASLPDASSAEAPYQLAVNASRLRTDRMIGIGLGVVVGVLVIIIVCWVAWSVIKRRRSSRDGTASFLGNYVDRSGKVYIKSFVTLLKSPNILNRVRVSASKRWEVEIQAMRWRRTYLSESSIALRNH